MQMTTTKKVFLTLAVTTMLVVSVYGTMYLVGNVQKLKSLTPSFNRIEPLGFKLKEQEYALKVVLNLKNDSQMQITASKYHLDVYLDNVFISPVISNDKQVIKGNSTSLFSFNIYFSPFKIFKDLNLDDLIGGLKNINKVKIKVTGYITASIGGVTVENFPVNLEMLVGDVLKSL